MCSRRMKLQSMPSHCSPPYQVPVFRKDSPLYPSPTTRCMHVFSLRCFVFVVLPTHSLPPSMPVTDQSLHSHEPSGASPFTVLHTGASFWKLFLPVAETRVFGANSTGVALLRGPFPSSILHFSNECFALLAWSSAASCSLSLTVSSSSSP